MWGYCRILSHLAISCRAMSNLAKFCEVLPRRVTFCHMLPKPVILRHVLSNIPDCRQIMENRAKSHQILPNLVTPCQILSCFAMSRQSCPYWRILKPRRGSKNKAKYCQISRNLPYVAKSCRILQNRTNWSKIAPNPTDPCRRL